MTSTFYFLIGVKVKPLMATPVAGLSVFTTEHVQQANGSSKTEPQGLDLTLTIYQ